VYERIEYPSFILLEDTMRLGSNAGERGDASVETAPLVCPHDQESGNERASWIKERADVD